MGTINQFSQRFRGAASVTAKSKVAPFIPNQIQPQQPQPQQPQQQSITVMNRGVLTEEGGEMTPTALPPVSGPMSYRRTGTSTGESIRTNNGDITGANSNDIDMLSRFDEKSNMGNLLNSGTRLVM